VLVNIFIFTNPACVNRKVGSANWFLRILGKGKRKREENLGKYVKMENQVDSTFFG
jgi:hypothetical protein